MKLKFIIISILTLNTGHTFTRDLHNQGIQPPTLRGYIKEMPAIRLDRKFSDPDFINLLHNRLNFRWDLGEQFHFALEGRNRVFYNEMFRNFPQYSDILAEDGGIIDMSWVWLSEGSWIGHSMIDRLYLDWQMEKWQVRVGRQRINWGINLVSNPNDLFNTYSFFDFDYAERPGTDAIRVQHFFGDMSRIQLAVSPARDSKDMVAAGMLNLNKWNYDFQALAGYYRNRLATGFGWAGHIRGAGFKGEATWFYDLEETEDVDRGNLVFATGMDYMFGSGTFAVIEFLYNGGFNRRPGEVFMINQPLRPDNIMFSEYAITISAQHPFSPVFQGRMALMALPDINAAFLMPGLNYSLMRNFDLEFVSQVFIGGRETLFEEAGSAWYLALQYSF